MIVLSYFVHNWLIKRQKQNQSQEDVPSPVRENEHIEQEEPSALIQGDYVKELEKIIYDYCEAAYQKKPSFHITKDTNFKRNLNFDGIDMAEIDIAFEKKMHVSILDDHPINQRLADDTDFTVEYYLSAHGIN